MEQLEARAVACVQAAIREVNEMRPPDEPLPDTGDTVLFGEGGLLDSLGVVNLAVALDAAIEREFGVSAGIVGELLAADDPGGFRTVDLLVHFVARRTRSNAS